jgi:hypothetical protein
MWFAEICIREVDNPFRAALQQVSLPQTTLASDRPDSGMGSFGQPKFSFWLFPVYLCRMPWRQLAQYLCRRIQRPELALTSRAGQQFFPVRGAK